MSCSAQIDARVGGSYRIEMHNPDSGEDHIVLGAYLAVEPNRRLVFDWRWITSEVATQVEVMFVAAGPDKTQISLYHRDFPDQSMCDKHVIGWNGCLAILSKAVA